ncbi:hypothetical protein HMPREF9630_01745 [Peptoanaerobacter stomatis]|uniref:Thioredoxin n=1 Tax=Peptoanaerobacter stomatis TaxID=796937 RepID=V9HQ60_9FIRM|nr:CD1871A family CXXC motif-containing protein [Peptoanaerobacter stomatis]EHL17062.1 hypothetical protein HMPREF9630_01745 [Peptoanaerobacter stomatis]
MNKKKAVPYILIILAIILMVVGINRGDLKGVLNKSVHICMECIGIG